jgi:hypothetical protein
MGGSHPAKNFGGSLQARFSILIMTLQMPSELVLGETFGMQHLQFLRGCQTFCPGGIRFSRVAFQVAAQA